MGYRNGQVPASALTAVFPGALMLNSVAVSVKTLVRVGKLEGRKITAAGGYAPAYRNLSDQKLYLDASHHVASAVSKLKKLGTTIDSSMTTSVGSVGFQSHGNADRIDLLFNGGHPTDADLALVKRYGGVQEFGDNDRNHMWFKSRVGTVTEADRNRIVCAWLNTLELGETSNTDKDGVWPADKCIFSHMLQSKGRIDGLYGSAYKVDGIRGTRTKWLRDHYFGILFK